MGHVTIVKKTLMKLKKSLKSKKINQSNRRIMKKVGIIMGSKSDLPIMQKAIDILNQFGIDTDIKIVSAHRTPEIMFEYANNVAKRT